MISKQSSNELSTESTSQLINTNIGSKADASATTDSGTFSLIALFKRLLEKLTSIISVKITDGAGVVNTKQISNQITGSDVALVTNTVIHGLSTGGGGGYVDVKVNPSGALTVESTISSSALPTGAATSAKQDTGNTSLSSIDTKLTSQATSSKQDLLLTELQLKADLTETQPVSLASVPLPANAAQETGGNLASILAQAVLLVAKDFATQTTLTSFSAKFTTDVHVRIHSGVYYHINDSVTLANNGVRNILIVVGAVKRPHTYMTVDAYNTSTNKSFEVRLFKNTIVSANGTALNSINLNDGGAAAATAFYHTPTITSDGTQLGDTDVGKDNWHFELRQGEEFMMALNTTYLLRVTSLIANNDVRLNIGFYEN